MSGLEREDSRSVYVSMFVRIYTRVYTFVFTCVNTYINLYTYVYLTYKTHLHVCVCIERRFIKEVHGV